ncbi:S1 family peptidase [Lysobacter sp. A3-1-A15]|uniref:S1 family peptidase n=1 Tax=Novilysobacter viscosus TaxID=3098602 RepID=UPI002EDB29DD
MNFHDCRRLLRAASFVLLASVATAASAIVVRHDVPDAAYLARESDFPAVFSLYRTKAGHNECIATLINARFAVTAAHCAREKSLLAATGPDSPGYEVKVAGISARIDRVIPHPGEGVGRPPDLALLRLAEPVVHVAPLPLYRGTQEVGQVIVLPGWGGTGNGESGLGSEDGLFRVAENRVDRAEGRRLVWRFDTPGQGPALTLEGISGPGDSGGPALLRTPEGWQVAGVSSSQDTMDGPEGLYGVEEYFVRISTFAQWIDAQVGAGLEAGTHPRCSVSGSTAPPGGW